jgi:hypothetical protein
MRDGDELLYGRGLGTRGDLAAAAPPPRARSEAARLVRAARAGHPQGALRWLASHPRLGYAAVPRPLVGELRRAAAEELAGRYLELGPPPAPGAHRLGRELEALRAEAEAGICDGLRRGATAAELEQIEIGRSVFELAWRIAPGPLAERRLAQLSEGAAFSAAELELIAAYRAERCTAPGQRALFEAICWRGIWRIEARLEGIGRALARADRVLAAADGSGIVHLVRCGARAWCGSGRGAAAAGERWHDPPGGERRCRGCLGELAKRDLLCDWWSLSDAEAAEFRGAYAGQLASPRRRAESVEDTLARLSACPFLPLFCAERLGRELCRRRAGRRGRVPSSAEIAHAAAELVSGRAGSIVELESRIAA